MLDESSIESFERDGVVPVRGLLTGELIDGLRELIPDLLARAPTGDGTSASVDGMWRQFESFARFLFWSPVGSVAAALMRSGSARLYEDLLLYKNASATGTNWHRDSPHWPVSGWQLSSIWFSLEEVTADTGAMRFVVGSHRDPDDLVSTASLDASSEVHQRRSITIEAVPGDVVAFHPRVLHSTHDAACDRPRRSFTLRFAGDDVRWRPRRSVYHEWMRDCQLQKGDVLDHPWFPVVS
jgi:ectoine hydroxylase-related dioxygenase (phytanoyl-CoA dioxygenase family)